MDQGVNQSGVIQGILRVRMFGGFALEYAGRPVTFSRSSSTKFIQLLQLLLLSQKQGVPKRQLIDSLYAWDEGANKNKNLNNVIYRLKKQLVSAGLPDEDYITLENGVCRFVSSFPVKVDAEDFDKCAVEAESVIGLEPADRKRKRELMQKAEALYTGEFLPEFGTELWVIEKNLFYKKQYKTVVLELGKDYHEAGDYQAERALYQKAAKIYPYDEWQAKEMDCLLAMKEYKEMYEVYEKTARTYCEDMGVPPGEEFLGRLRMMESQMTHPVGSFEEIKKNLQEMQGEGAYYCHYPSFLDSCHLLARLTERNGRSIFLLLCGLTEKNGQEIMDREKLEEQMHLLKGVIQETLRRGDLYTRYSRSQYLIILVGTAQENCATAFMRIQRNWRKAPGRRGELTYSVSSLLQMTEVELIPQDKKPSWGKNTKKWKN